MAASSSEVHNQVSEADDGEQGLDTHRAESDSDGDDVGTDGGDRDEDFGLDKEVSEIEEEGVDMEDGRPLPRFVTRNGFNDGVQLVRFVKHLLLRDKRFSYIAQLLGTSTFHLRRTLGRFGWTGIYRLEDEQEIQQMLLKLIPLQASGTAWGIRNAHGALRRAGVKVAKSKVQAALRMIDPERMSRRYRLVIDRRMYNVEQPMRVWHLDSWCKLAPWNIWAHAIIDGYSHYIVAAKLCTNRRQESLYDIYAEAVKKFGRPRLLRSDWAPDFNLIEADMDFTWGEDAHTFIRGPSTRNQRIERWWREVYDRFGWYYKRVTENLEVKRLFDPRNDLDRYSFNEVFLPELDARFDEFVEVWNWHEIRRCKRGTHSRELHIPTAVFQADERMLGIVPSLTHKNVRQFGVNLLENSVPCSLGEIEQRVRNEAFCMHAENLNVQKRFILHLDLSLECEMARANGMPLEDHFAVVAQEGDPHRLAVCFKLAAAIDQLDVVGVGEEI